MFYTSKTAIAAKMKEIVKIILNHRVFNVHSWTFTKLLLFLIVCVEIDYILFVKRSEQFFAGRTIRFSLSIQSERAYFL